MILKSINNEVKEPLASYIIILESIIENLQQFISKDCSLQKTFDEKWMLIMFFLHKTSLRLQTTHSNSCSEFSTKKASIIPELNHREHFNSIPDSHYLRRPSSSHPARKTFAFYRTYPSSRIGLILHHPSTLFCP